MSEAELSVIADPNPSHPPDEVQPKYDQPWTENTEHELMEIHTKCIQLSDDHDRAMRRSKCKYTVFGLPSMLVPLIAGGISEYLTEETEWVRSAALIVTAVNSGIMQFFNFGSKQSQHNESAGRYQELADMVKMELSKPSAFRVSCDVFMERVFVKYQYINSSAPIV
jgi:hypothetical protein